MKSRLSKIKLLFILLVFYIPGVYLIIDHIDTNHLMFGIFLLLSGIINHQIVLGNKVITNFLVKYL